MSEELIEDKMNKLTLNEKPSRRFKFSPDLKEYLIKSKISSDEKKYYLPTPKNLNTLFQLNVVKNQCFFDLEKYKSFVKIENDENVLDFSEVHHIQNSKILNSVLFFLGAINLENDIYDFDDEEEEENELRAPIPEENLYENSDNYTQYLQNNLPILTRDIAFIDLDELIKSLEEIGMRIVVDNKNTLYRQIKDNVMSSPENKIMVLITPSNNFYVKTEKNSIT